MTNRNTWPYHPCNGGRPMTTRRAFLAVLAAAATPAISLFRRTPPAAPCPPMQNGLRNVVDDGTLNGRIWHYDSRTGRHTPPAIPKETLQREMDLAVRQMNAQFDRAFFRTRGSSPATALTLPRSGP